MDFSKFSDCIQKMIECTSLKNSTSLGAFLDQYDELVEKLDDRDRNLKRWLQGRPCVFEHPKTKRRVSVFIGADPEAVYEMLLFCRQLNNHIEPVAADFDRLAYLLSRAGEEENA